jgi:hypothetical protein
VSFTAEVQEHGGEVAWRQALFFNVEHAEKTGFEVREAKDKGIKVRC